jgi:hypothetical protein
MKPDDPHESGWEAPVMYARAAAYNVDAEDDLGMTDDEYMDFQEAMRIFFAATQALKGIDDALADINEQDEDGIFNRQHMCQAALKGIISDLERIEPKYSHIDGGCMVRIKDPSADLLKTLEDRKERAANARKRLADVEETRRKFFNLADAAGAEVIRLKGEIRKTRKEALALRREKEAQGEAQDE